MKKTISLFLAFVMLCCTVAGTGISAYASTSATKATTVEVDTVYEIQTEFDERIIYEMAHSWVKFKPTKTGTYVLWAAADTEEDLAVPMIYTSLTAAKENDTSKVLQYDGAMQDSKNKYRIGYVTNLTADKMYYIDICALNMNSNFSEPLVTFSIKSHTHNYADYIIPADTEEDGEIGKACKLCYAKKNTKKIPYVKTIKLSATSYTYNGKTRKPTVTVKDRNGKALVEGTDYKLTYSKGRKSVGRYTVTVKLIGKYDDTVKKTFTIKPKATSITSASAAKKAFTVKWKKQTSQTTGYQVQYSRYSSFKNATSVTVSQNSTTSKKITGLAGKQKYYVRVRTYKMVNGTKIYSSWSKTKTVTTKK